jgi:hypothetical protein
MVKQNIVFVENRSGSLREVTKLLADNQVDIYGFACFDAPEFAVFRMVCSDAEKAGRILSENGYMNRLTDVIVVDLQDAVGTLDELLAVIHDSNVNLNYIYTSFHRVDQIPVVIICSEANMETESVLQNRGFRVLDNVEKLKK